MTIVAKILCVICVAYLVLHYNEFCNLLEKLLQVLCASFEQELNELKNSFDKEE